MYCADVDEWETMDIETLENWYNRLDTDFNEFPMYRLK